MEDGIKSFNPLDRLVQARRTDHMQLLGLIANRNMDSIDNPSLVRLKQETLSWSFKVVYIPGKKL